LSSKDNTSNRHKGVFTGVHLTDDQLLKVELIAKAFDNSFGDAGRNRGRAIRWLIDAFDESWLDNFPEKPTIRKKSTRRQKPKED